MKKPFPALLCLILIFCSVIALSACGPVDEIPEPDPEIAEPVTPPHVNYYNDVWNPEVCIQGAEEDPKACMRPEDKSIYGVPDAVDTRLSDDENVLILINKYHALSKDYVPGDLVVMNPEHTNKDDWRCKAEVNEAYEALWQAAKEEGYTFKCKSAYRSYSDQNWLFSKYMDEKGEEWTLKQSAYPGRSEHQTGLALDISAKSVKYYLSPKLGKAPEGIWLKEHCAEFGFIIRYGEDRRSITGYTYEPWHVRYVGVEAAREIMERDITLEEYLEDVRGQEDLPELQNFVDNTQTE